MRALRAFLLGAVAIGFVAYATTAATAIVAQARDWEAFELAVGPVVLIAVERAGGATATTFGSGLLVAAALGGVLNSLASIVLARRSR